MKDSHHRLLALFVSVLALTGLVFILKSPPAQQGHHPPAVPYHAPTPKGDAAPVSVSFSNPQGTGFNPQGAPTIVATFSQAMVPLAQLGDAPPVQPFQFDPALPGHYRWIGSHTVTYIPDHLPYATHYTVTIPAGLVSEEGGTLKQAFSWTFETRRPELESSWTGGDDTHVAPGARVYLNFNQPVQATAVKPFVQLTGTDAQKHANPVAVDVRPLTDDELKRVRDERWTNAQPTQLLAVVPAAALPLDTEYSLLLKAGLPGVEGNLGATADNSLSFSTYGPLNFIEVADSTKVQPEDGVEFRFSNPVKVVDLLKHTTFDPPVTVPKDLDVYESSELNVALNLKANTQYHFKMDGDLTDTYGQKISSPASGEFHTIHFRKWLSVKEGLWSLEAAQPHQIPVGLVNIHSLQVGLQAVTADTVVPLLHTLDSPPSAPAQALHEWSGAEHDDVVTWKNLNLEPALNGKQQGLVWVQLEDPTQSQNQRQHNTLVAVTNLGLTLKSSPENTSIWVTTLRQGTPVAGAQVQLRDAGNRVLWRGVADKNGLALAPGWHALGLRGKDYDVPTLYALASQGDDLVVTQSGMVDAYAFDISSNPSGIYPNTECFLFTERGLYRAGEDVNFKGMYRQIRNGQWTVKAGMPLHLTLTSARGDKVAEADVKTDDFGSFSFTHHLSDTAPSGDWSITASTSDPKAEFRNDFQVQAFKPVTFEVKVTTAKPLYKQGETLQANVAGKYLFGAPVQNGDLNWTLSLSGWAPSWPDFDSFRFGRDAWLDRTAHGFADAGEGEETELLFARGQNKLSADGQFQANVALSGDKLPADNRTLSLEATVEAPGHHQVSGRVAVPLFAGDFTLGLKPQTDFLEAGKPQSVDVIAVTSDGKPEAGHSVHVRLMRRDWDSVRHDPSAAWDTSPHDTEIRSQDVMSADKPVSATFTPDTAGFYYLEATCHDNSADTLTATTSFWVYGGGYVAWSRGDGDRINLVADKRHYKPGDTARIMVQNPYEQAYALITVERELVLQRRVELLHGSAPIVEIPLDTKDLPNVYVSVVLLAGRKGEVPKYDAQGEDVGRPSFKLGYLNLPVDATEQQLKVTVSCDHPRYGPGDTVTVNLLLHDAQGHPVLGDVALAAVDKGVLNLIGYETPDPFADFYGSRSLAVQTSETRSFILGAHKTGEKGAPGGGGGGELAGLLNVRKNFKMTAYWNPSVRTDATGQASVQFKLPDNLSSFRVMAVAATRTSQFGSAQTEFTVNKPLVLSASIPRFATVGDTFSGGVTVTNNTPERQNVTVHATVTGLTLVGSADKTLDVPAQGTREFLFDYQAPGPPNDGSNPPPAAMVYAGAMAGDQDNLEVGCPLLTPKVLEAVATGGDTDKADKEVITVPTGVWPGTSRLEVGMASTALVSLRSALQSLVQYPYGCLEQKLSRVYPLILGEQLAPQFGLPNFDTARAHKYVETFLAEFPTYQKSSGGCTLWGTATDDEDPFVSAYAYVVLTQAAAHGYDVPKQSLEALHSYVSGLLTLEEAGWHWSYTKADRLAIQCLALYGLAINGDDISGSVNHLYDQRQTLSLTAQAWLARAMARTGKFQAQEHQLAIQFQQGIQLDPTTGYVENPDVATSDWIYTSRVRTTAVVLSALLDLNQTQHTPEMMQWLLKHSKGGAWFSTQDNAWALDAALTYLQKMEHDTPDFTATATLDGKPVDRETFKGRSTRVSSKSLALDDASAGKDLPLNLDLSGTGRLYYTCRLFYSPKDGQGWARDEGLAIDKHVTDLNGKDPGDIKAGQVYMVTLTLVSPRERTFVVVDDPVPAGFEVVNTDFETESQALARTLNKAQDKDAQQDGTWFGTFNHWEIYDDKVLLFADQLVPGAHRFTYLARAMYPGAFWQGSTRAEAMYEPETFGGTAAAHVTVAP